MIAPSTNGKSQDHRWGASTISKISLIYEWWSRFLPMVNHKIMGPNISSIYEWWSRLLPMVNRKIMGWGKHHIQILVQFTNGDRTSNGKSKNSFNLCGLISLPVPQAKNIYLFSYFMGVPQQTIKPASVPSKHFFCPLQRIWLRNPLFHQIPCKQPNTQFLCVGGDLAWFHCWENIKYPPQLPPHLFQNRPVCL